MESLDFTPQILKKFNIPFDVVKKQGDVLSGSDVKVRDIYTNDCKSTLDIFPHSDNTEDNGFLA